MAFSCQNQIFMAQYIMLAQNCPNGKRQWLNSSNLLFSDGQHRTRGGNCEMLEITWQVLTSKAVFHLKKRKLISPIELHCTN